MNVRTKHLLTVAVIASLACALLGLPVAARAEITVMSYNICGICTDENAPLYYNFSR